MEFFVANFIANKEDFFKAKIQQSDNDHVSVNGNKFMILGERKFEKHLEAIVSPENIQYFFDEIKEGLSRELVKLDYTTHTVILLVRPSGIKKMQAIADMVRGYGLSYGRDPLEEDVEVSLGKAGGGDL